MEKEGQLEVTPGISLQQVSNKDTGPVMFCDLTPGAQTAAMNNAIVSRGGIPQSIPENRLVNTHHSPVGSGW